MRKYILEVDATNGKGLKKELDEQAIIGPVDYGVYEHFKHESYRFEPEHENNVFVFGNGCLAGSILPGTHRLVFVSRSPVTRSLMLSSIGGAGTALHKAGLDFVKVYGRSAKLSVLLISNIDSYLSTELIPIERQKVFELYEQKNSQGEDRGIYGLGEHLLNEFRPRFFHNGKHLEFRIVLVGPAAFNTVMGAMNSILIKNGQYVTGAEGWAGRAGFGSALLHAHNICAIVVGGNADWKRFPKADLRDSKVVNEIFQTEVNKSMFQAVKDATVKYRYDESIKTGGTLGCNLATSGAWTPMFNWRNVLLSREKRQELYNKLILEMYLKEFNQQTIETKQWKSCGEPCMAVCKKVRGDKKKDYESYAAFGPNMGVFHQAEAEHVAQGLEGMGFDSIGGGNMISFLLEAVHLGLIKKQDAGLTQSPNYDADSFNIKQSAIHSNLAYKLALDIGYGRTELGRMFDKGVRIAVKRLAEKYGQEVKGLISYNAFGEDGYSVPCQYWVPGFWAPVHITGKFFTYYQKDYRDPYDLGKKCAERSILEMYSENTGICRFHRQWSEVLVPLLINRAYGMSLDYREHCRQLIRKIMQYNDRAGALPVFWENEKTVDIIHGYLKEIAGTMPKVPDWLNRFNADKWKAAEEYWHEMKRGIAETFL